LDMVASFSLGYRQTSGAHLSDNVPLCVQPEN
jgi:hypothetical protein